MNMYHQFVPSEEEFGFIPDVKFDKNNPSGAFGSVAIVKTLKARNYTLMEKNVHIDKNEDIIVKKYKSLLEQFEYEESNYIFSQWSDSSPKQLDQNSINFNKWKIFDLISIGVNSRLKTLRTFSIWNNLVKQRQQLLNSLRLSEDHALSYLYIKKAAEKKGIGVEYFKNIQLRCHTLMKTMLEMEVGLQQQLANTTPQAAPTIYGYDDEKFTISMQKLESEIVDRYRTIKIPDYLQYQMIALTKLFNTAKVKRNDGNVKNYMIKGLRVYAIDVGLDKPLEQGETNSVSKMFFSRYENSLYRRMEGVDILRQALDSEIRKESIERGLDIMNFLDAAPELNFFQLEDVYTEEDIRKLSEFEKAEPLFPDFLTNAAKSVVNAVSDVIRKKPVTFWGNETWWCARVENRNGVFTQTKYILSKMGQKINIVAQITPAINEVYQQMITDFLKDLPEARDSSIILTYLHNKYKH
jgi:tRNA A-37 threonylcarbamoyl transferase component Bud32